MTRRTDWALNPKHSLNPKPSTLDLSPSRPSNPLSSPPSALNPKP